jgi:hypothetical protein
MKTKEIGSIILITLASTLLLWLPFFGGFSQFLGFPIPPGGLKTILANYDGPNYLVIAKTWYQKKLIAKNFSLPLPLEYYPAHFPGFPFLIYLFDQILPATTAMLSVALLTSILAALAFYFFITKLKLSQNPFWLTLIFLFLPARYFITRSVGAPEPLFIFSILASFFFFRKKKYWPAGFFGALAQFTKTPGILLFGAYGLYLIYDLGREKKSISRLFRSYPLALIPLTALAVFLFYQTQTGNFLAYFQSGDNFHLTSFPFQALNSGRSWLGGIWIEDMIWLYLIAALGIISLFKQKLPDLGIFALVFYLATLFVAHRDISRYSLPIWPFLLIGLDPFLQKKEFKIAFLIILPAIYLYGLNFILGNSAPIADWTPYL